MVREQFLTFMRGAILALPQTLKAALRLAEEPDIPDEGRILVAGAIVHWLSRTNSIPGVRGGASAYVDDVLVLMLAFERLTKLSPDGGERLRADSPELFETLESDLALSRSYFGGAIQLLEQALARVAKLKHMGRTPQQCVKDEAATTMLYEEVIAALVDFDPAPEAVGRELKDLDAIIDDLRRKAG